MPKIARLQNLEPRQHIDPAGIAIALRMQQLRHDMGLTQAEFCFYLKISRETYWRWERFGPPRSPVVRQFCKMVIAKLTRTRKRTTAQQARRAAKRKRHAQEQAARTRTRLDGVAD